MSLIQEQEQTTKTLTFEDICPDYSSKIANWDQLSWLEQNVVIRTVRQNAKSCIVGEAHGYNSDYISECGDCGDYACPSYGFPLAFRWGDGKIDHEMFEEIKNRFVAHFNQEHR